MELKNDDVPKDSDYLIFNPDTVWNEKYIQEINKMQEFYFQKN